jgi:hypothetical protein
VIFPLSSAFSSPALIVFISCADQSVAVRKQAVVTLTHLLSSMRTDSTLQQVWIESVLPLVHDPETTIQTKICQGVIDLILLGSIAPLNSPMCQATWSLCSKVNEAGNIKFMKSVFALLKRSAGGSGSTMMNSIDKSLPEIFRAVKEACCIHDPKEDEEINIVQDPETVSRGGWVLLEALVSQSIGSSSTSGKRSREMIVSGEFVIDRWSKKQQQKSEEGALSFDDLDTRMLQVMSKVPIQVSQVVKDSVAQQLVSMICAGKSDSQGVAAALSVIFSFAASELNANTSKGRCQYDIEWLQLHTGALLNYVHLVLHEHLAHYEEAEELFSDPRLSSFMWRGPHPHKALGTPTLCSAIFLLGEIAMLGFSMEEDEDTYKTRSCNPLLPSVALSDISNTFRIEIPPILAMMIQTLMGYSKFASDDSLTFGHSFDTALTANSSMTQDTAEFPHSSENSSRVRAQSFITMGKLCLRSRQRARDNVTIFLREIQSSSGEQAVRGNSAVRSNAILVLGDLCVRFTNLVDRHVGSMAICLQDPDVLVRRHSFILLTQLLLQDYLKWRGMLLFRFLATILDPDEEMASLARYVLKHTLQSKYSGFIVQNFTESMIVFNNCTDHLTYQTMAALGSDGGIVVSMDGIDLHGSKGKEKRMRIYEFMLEEATEEEKIQITSNISQDIFTYALDFPIQRPKTSKAEAISPLEHALMDAFQILQSPLMRIGKSKTTGASSSEVLGDEDADDLVEASQQAGGGTESSQEALKSSFQKAKSKVLKKLSLQHLIDHMLPLISSLKHLLEAVQSPAQKALMDYLVFIMRSNKAEATQALNSDPTLKEEIEYDIKVYEKEKQKESQRREILAAEKAVVTLEVSTARKAPLGSVCLSAISPSHGTASEKAASVQRLSLSTGKTIATPVLKKKRLSIGGLGSSASSSSLRKLVRSDSGSVSHTSHLSSFDNRNRDQEMDDFTLRMTQDQSEGEEAHHEARGVTRRRSGCLIPLTSDCRLSQVERERRKHQNQQSPPKSQRWRT